MSEFTEQVSGIGLLAEPQRREIYLFVCAQTTSVSRDDVAEAMDIPRHKAKFHLDKLEGLGLLEADFARLTGRSGPGAGRPSKLYRRSPDEIAVSLPERDYQLAGRLLAEAIATSERTGTPVLDELRRAAAEQGRSWGRAATADTSSGRDSALDVACRALVTHGYEPREDDNRIVLANCPFHTLAASHTEMVCGMNLALVDALADEVDPTGLTCHLEPADGRCCVVLEGTDVSPATSQAGD